MTAGSIFFVFSALLVLSGAIGTVMAKNPIRSAVGLLVTIAGIAALFLRLEAQFLAAIQLIVYAGAVVVLFVFVIMLLGPDATAGAARPARARLSRWVSGVALALLAGAGLFTVGARMVEPTPLGVVPGDYGSIEAVGGMIFTRGIVPFEIATALLIVAVVGAVAVARTHHKKKAPRLSESPTRRMFHGPLHPRDAERPLPEESAS